jgi:hypothetical protein
MILPPRAPAGGRLILAAVKLGMNNPLKQRKAALHADNSSRVFVRLSLSQT